MIRKTVATRVAVVFVAASLSVGGSVVGAFAHSQETATTASETSELSPAVLAQIADLKAKLALAESQLDTLEATLDRLDERDETAAPTAAELEIMSQIAALEKTIKDLEAQIEALESEPEAKNNVESKVETPEAAPKAAEAEDKEDSDKDEAKSDKAKSSKEHGESGEHKAGASSSEKDKD